MTSRCPPNSTIQSLRKNHDLCRPGPGSVVLRGCQRLCFPFQPHALFGLSCTDLLRRVELQELSGYTSTLVLGEVAHRLMTLEASTRFGWPTKIVDRLKQNPATVQRLVHFRSALQKIPQMGIQVLTI